jgi:CubicO group peptidase (beta-lactamase class C family)
VALFAVILGVAGSHLSLASRLLLILLVPALSMVAWEVLVRRVYRSPTAGLRWDAPREWRIHGHRALVKVVGLWATWTLIAVCYAVAAALGGGLLDAYMAVLVALVPFLAVGSLIYFVALEPHLEEPFDGHWHCGLILLGRWRAVHWPIVADHLRSWTIKAFFLAFLGTMVGPLVAYATSGPLTDVGGGVVGLVLRITALLFLADVVFGTIGYALTFRVLDSHIRSANPYVLAWAAALACYPPFILMGRGGFLDYKGTLEWMDIVPAGTMSHLWAAALVALVAVYAWCTVAFGIRFSNLTHRGILTAGPYAVLKHPAYVAKNLYWWLLYLPFAAASTPAEAFRNTLLLLAVNAIYLIRARTEEQHLLADPVYREYASWIDGRNRAVIKRGWEGLRHLIGAPPAASGSQRRNRMRALRPAQVLGGLTVAVMLVSILSAATTRTASFQPGHTLGEFLKDEGLLGGVMAILTPDGETSIHASGWSGLYPRQRMLPDQRFQVASLSKPITSAAILALAGDGRLDLDSPVLDVLTEFRGAGDPRYHEITIRHLLAHEGGWRVSGWDPALDPAAISCRDVAVQVVGRALDYPPGQAQAYSNVGYCFLELVIERVSGVRYEDLVRAEVLAPSRVADMSLDPAGTRHFARSEGLWRPASTHILGTRPALGGWSANAGEYLEFMQRTAPHAEGGGHGHGESHYFLGWRMWPELGGLATHYGYFEGIFSVAATHPDGWAAVALFNSAPRDAEKASRRLVRKLEREAMARARIPHFVSR